MMLILRVLAAEAFLRSSSNFTFVFHDFVRTQLLASQLAMMTFAARARIIIWC
jgi:hypothetical protein